jgi:CheY-like chemotaxis protein
MQANKLRGIKPQEVQVQEVPEEQEPVDSPQEKNIVDYNIVKRKKEEQPKEEKKLKCLLVNDDQMQLFVMTAVFRGLGYEVTASQNGFEAFEIVQSIVKRQVTLEELSDQMFCLVLLDLNMPISDGYETCRNITNLCNNNDFFTLKRRRSGMKN